VRPIHASATRFAATRRGSWIAPYTAVHRLLLVIGLLLPCGRAAAQDAEDARRLRRSARATYLGSGIVLTHAAIGMGLFGLELHRAEEATGLDAIGHAAKATFSLVLSSQAGVVGLVMLVVAFVLDAEAGLADGATGARAPPCLGLCAAF